MASLVFFTCALNLKKTLGNLFHSSFFTSIVAKNSLLKNASSTQIQTCFLLNIDFLRHSSLNYKSSRQHNQLLPNLGELKMILVRFKVHTREKHTLLSTSLYEATCSCFAKCEVISLFACINLYIICTLSCEASFCVVPKREIFFPNKLNYRIC